MARKKKLPSEPVVAHIEALTHEGQGIARIDGKAVFISGALPGEQVLFRYTDRHSQYDHGVTLEVLQASQTRVTPECAHFGVCGGCSLQHLEHTQQVAHKQNWLLDSLRRIGKVEPQHILAPLTGLTWGYRRKARLAVKHVVKKGKVLVGFRERATPYVADLQRCVVLHPRVGELLPQLSELIGQLSIREQLPQIEVAVGDDSVALSLRVLSAPDATDQQYLREFAQQHDLQLYLQPQGLPSTQLFYPEQEQLRYFLPRYDLAMQFKPYHFTQVNHEINRQMLDQALELLQLAPEHTVLDLFCGLGNFTLPLARRVQRVVGVEGERSLVEWAQRNAALNQISNAEFHVADLSADISAQPWRQQRYQRILIDPPRSGALEMMPHIAALGAERIVYVSCHPATLARDVGILVQEYGYQLASAGIMDMFPHTAHVESMALLVKR